LASTPAVDRFADLAVRAVCFGYWRDEKKGGDSGRDFLWKKEVVDEPVGK
jgi:hypothetical protein